MSDIERAVLESGGRIVASFELDEFGQTIGNLRRGERGASDRKIHHCAACGDVGHNVRRCNGAGRPPKPLAKRHTRAETKPELTEPKPCSRCGATDHDARRHNTGRRTYPETP